VYLPPMLGWFFFSALLSTYNKFVFGDGHMAFPCPLLLTSMHFAIQWILSHLACALFPTALGTERVDRMSWKEWASVSIPCGLVTAFDVGLSNLSLVTITITFYTMVKSSTPIFVLGWAYVFGIEKITWRLVGVIMVIAAGEFLTVVGEVDFVLHGFLLCLTASVLSGARWTLVQLKLQRLDPPLKTTLVTMKLLAPSMFFGMLIISLAVEQPWTKFSTGTGEKDELMRVLFLGMVGGLLAVAMVLCEFYLILHASAIILMIGGVIKEMTTIMIGVTFFGDQLNVINVSGCAVVFTGVVLYKLVFHLEKAEEKVESALREKNAKEDVDSRLIRDSHHQDDFRDKDEEAQADFVSSRRSLELVDRHARSPLMIHPSTMQVDEEEHELPALRGTSA